MESNGGIVGFLKNEKRVRNKRKNKTETPLTFIGLLFQDFNFVMQYSAGK